MELRLDYDGVVIPVYSLLHPFNVPGRHNENRFAHSAFAPSVKFFNRLFASVYLSASLRSRAHGTHELIVCACIV